MKKFTLIFILISSFNLKAQLPPYLLSPYQSPTSYNAKLDSTYVPGKTYRVDDYSYNSTNLDLELTGHYIVETDNYLLQKNTWYNDNVVYNTIYDKYVYTYLYQQNKLKANAAFLKNKDSLQPTFSAVDSFSYINGVLNYKDTWYNNSSNQLHEVYGNWYKYDSLHRFTGTDAYNLVQQPNMSYSGYYTTDSFTVNNLPAKVSNFSIKDTLKTSRDYYLYFYDSLSRPRYILHYFNQVNNFMLNDSIIYFFSSNKIYPDTIIDYPFYSNLFPIRKTVFSYSTIGAISEIDYSQMSNGLFIISNKEVYSTNLNTGLKTINPIDNSINIYPNPATDKLFIQSQKEKVLSYKIIDMQGKILADERLNSESISLNGISTGILVVQLKLSDGTTISKRVLKTE